ncbi:MAG: bilirubin oxidase, partial [Anaerolineaceae bacterium]|nr:bilirubin oxidase [Anaerolineaceae bacterium]
MIGRRGFLKLGFAAGVGFFLSNKLSLINNVLAAIPGGDLDLTTVPKYQDPLVIPPAMPLTKKIVSNGELIDYYEIAVRQFNQFILPRSLGKQTTVWSYGSETSAGTYNYPAFTIEATQQRPVRVKWINKLVDAQN